MERPAPIRRDFPLDRRGMPRWDDVLKPEDIEALWAYVLAGEAKK